MDLFDDAKIIKVSPGTLSKYVNEKTISTPVEDTQSELSDVPSINFSDRTSGTFKYYIHYFKISRSCMKHIKSHHKPPVHMVLRWSIFDRDECLQSPEMKEEQKIVKLHFSKKYQLEINTSFIYKIRHVPVEFKLYASTVGKEELISTAYLSLENLVDLVNIKEEQRLYFLNADIDSSGRAVAYLLLWYKFSCKHTLSGMFPFLRWITKKKQCIVKSSDLLGSKFSKQSQNLADVHVTESEFDHFADSVWLVLNRNKVLKTTQSDINKALQERVRWLHFEANWKQTLQEHAILHGKDPEAVIWRQWREEDTANVRLRTYDDIVPRVYRPELSITVVDLYFLEGCSVLRNYDLRLFYVEYSFLGFEGPEMETPESLPKLAANEKIEFNFKKKFPIDIENNYENCLKLTELIKSDQMIKFVIISEPMENEDKPIQTCQEIGYATVLFSELIQLQTNEDTFEYEVIDIHNPIVLLGYLTVKVEGILAMRKMALDFMAPNGYKLYM